QLQQRRCFARSTLSPCSCMRSAIILHARVRLIPTWNRRHQYEALAVGNQLETEDNLGAFSKPLPVHGSRRELSRGEPPAPAAEALAGGKARRVDHHQQTAIYR